MNTPTTEEQPDDAMDEIDSMTPRVSTCINSVMRRFPATSRSAQARYFEEVHQELAPLARQLENELAEAKAQIVEAWKAARRSPPPAAKGVEGWKPIETAPKSKDVLLCCAGTFVPIYCGRYRDGRMGEPNPDYVAWRCSSSGRYADPTHWMPLPPPPAITKAGKS